MKLLNAPLWTPQRKREGREAGKALPMLLGEDLAGMAALALITSILMQ